MFQHLIMTNHHRPWSRIIVPNQYEWLTTTRDLHQADPPSVTAAPNGSLAPRRLRRTSCCAQGGARTSTADDWAWKKHEKTIRVYDGWLWWWRFMINDGFSQHQNLWWSRANCSFMLVNWCLIVNDGERFTANCSSIDDWCMHDWWSVTEKVRNDEIWWWLVMVRTGCDAPWWLIIIFSTQISEDVSPALARTTLLILLIIIHRLLFDRH